LISEIEYCCDVFGTGQILKSLKGVTSLGEGSEGSVVFRVLNEDPAEVGNKF
jgi:hypothetical protein